MLVRQMKSWFLKGFIIGVGTFLGLCLFLVLIN